MLLDVALETGGELTDTRADIGVPVASGREHERLLDPGDEEFILAPGERGEEGRARPQGQGHMCRRQERRPSEELDPLANTRHGTVREDAEHAAVADDPVDPDGRVHRHEHEALRLPCSIDGTHELGVGFLGGKRKRVPARDEDLPHQRDRSEVRAAEDHALAETLRAHEVVPPFDTDDRVKTRAIQARDLKYLEVLPDLIHEHAPGAQRPARRDRRQVRADRGSAARCYQIRHGPGDLGDQPLPCRRHSRQDSLGRSGERPRSAHGYGVPSGRVHIGRNMYHWSGSPRTSCSRP